MFGLEKRCDKNFKVFKITDTSINANSKEKGLEN